MEERELKSAQDYPLNGWWAAATTDELSEKPLARTLLQKPIALFRTSAGVPCAFMDRCPHRWTPLSRGTVIGDEIVCPYHGFRYNTNGECTLAPSERAPPRALRVRTYPVVERGPFVWLWMGDPSNADPALLPEFTWHGDAPVRVAGYRRTQCGFVLIHENIADTEHTLYLHGESFGNSNRSGYRNRVHGVMEVEGHKITFLASARDLPPSKLDAALFDLQGNEGIDVSTVAAFTAPGCFSSEMKCTRRTRNPGIADKVITRYLWCATPISANSCHFWWDLTFDRAASGQKAVEEIWNQAIEEDIEIVQAIQGSMDSRHEFGNGTEGLVGADRAVATIRQLLKTMTESSSADAQT